MFAVIAAIAKAGAAVEDKTMTAKIFIDGEAGTTGLKILERLEGRAVGVSPEYEACRRIALEKGIPIQDVYRRVQREAEDTLIQP